MPNYPLPSDPWDQRPGLKPPQFGMSTVLWLFAGLAVAMFAFRTAGPLLATVIVLFALAIGVHVIGNAMGTKLRDQSDESRRDNDPRESR